MPIFEHYAEEARRIEQEIVRQGIVLGIDWQDAVAVRTLAREALAYHPADGEPVSLGDAPEKRAKLAMFGLAQLMLKVMAESAAENVTTHGGEVWKTLGRALWAESGQVDYATRAGERNSRSASEAGKGTEK
ncbi:MAG: hypothetical protein HZC22_11885 [Rhodocyclales bacterium]|nr:hypothetical protein [Rhodocyclales bacterium]